MFLKRIDKPWELFQKYARYEVDELENPSIIEGT